MQRQTADQGDTGQRVGAWNEIAKEWASIKPISGREYFNASGERAEITHRIEIRQSASRAYRPRDRIVYGERVFNIKSVLDVDERHRMLQLMVSEYVAD
jgi:SPP1 family predicted phage head-tail adaptor